MNNLIILLLPLIGAIYAFNPLRQNNVHTHEQCVVTNFENVSIATANCQDIFIDDLYVPAGETLLLDLLDGATVTIRGNVTFGFVNWAGPLVRVYGSGVTVQGVDGHILNGRGEQYWDRVGSWGTKKPKFMIIEVTGGSVFRNLHLYNAPMHGISINNSHDVLFTDFLIDNSAGAENVAPWGHAGHNTDGFGVNRSTNVIIRDSRIYNQDDCIALNSGSNIYVTNLFCHGSHGLSLSVGFSNETIELNTLTNVVIENSTIIDAMDGIHIKTHIDAGIGEVTNITYRNIVMLGSYSYGISIEQNYTNSKTGGKGATPLSNIPITGLKFSNIKGSTRNTSIPYYIVCAQGGCTDWEWEDVNVYGIKKSTCVNMHPDVIDCVDYTL